MTAPLPPPSGHLDLDALADVVAGESDDPHLSSCDSCAARLAELSEAQAGVARALAALPDPALPEGLGLRLTAALDAAAGPAPAGTQAAGPAATEAAGPAGTAGRAPSGGTTGPGAGHRTRPASSRVTALPRRVAPSWITAAAASLVLVLAGGLGYSLMSAGGPAAGDAATSAAGGAVESDRSSQESSDSALAGPAEPESDASVSSRSEAAEPGSAQRDTSEAADPAASGAAGAGASSAAAPARSATGADYADQAQRAAVLPRLLAGPDPDDAPVQLLADGPLARLRAPSALDACLAAVTGGSGVVPLALDEAFVGAEPALAVVLPSEDPGEVVVRVVGGACAKDEPDELLVFRASRG